MISSTTPLIHSHAFQATWKSVDPTLPSVPDHIPAPEAKLPHTPANIPGAKAKLPRSQNAESDAGSRVWNQAYRIAVTTPPAGPAGPAGGLAGRGHCDSPTGGLGYD